MADSFTEALLKAGKISQTDINKRDQEEEKKAKAILEEKKKKEKIEFDKRTQERKDFENAMKPFDDMWASEKAHKFASHLIFSFTPLHMGEYAWGNEELKSRHCCICRCKLMSKDDLFKKQKDIVDASITHLRNFVMEDFNTANERLKESMGKIIGGRTLGVVSPKSTAAFCSTCFNRFGDWVSNKIVCGNREINGIVRKRMVEIAMEMEAEKNATVTDNGQDAGDTVSGEVSGSQTEGEGRGVHPEDKTE